MVLAFEAAEAVLEARLIQRGLTSGRADDNLESIKKRYATFKAQSEPVISHYQATRPAIVKVVNSERPVGEVFEDVKPLFVAELARMGGAPVAAAAAAAAPAPVAAAVPAAAAAPQPTPAAPLSLVFVLGGPGSGKGKTCWQTKRKQQQQVEWHFVFVVCQRLRLPVEWFLLFMY